MTFSVKRLVAGYYRVTAPNGYANVKIDRRDEHRGKWVCEIRNNASNLVQYAGVWNTMREGVAEAQMVLKS